MAVGLGGLAGLQLLVSSGALAVNFTTTDRTFAIYSNYVQGVYGAGYLTANNGSTAAGRTGVAELGFKSAKLAGLCAISTDDVPGIGTVSLMITAGVPVRGSFSGSSVTATDGAGAPITYDADGLLSGPSDAAAINTSDMYLDSNALSGYGNRISGLNLGQNAATVGGSAGLTFPTASGAPAATAGGFGLFSRHLNISGLDGGAYGVDLAGQINLPHLKISTQLGPRTQADCPTHASTS
jgi:hypothetical protein